MMRNLAPAFGMTALVGAAFAAPAALADGLVSLGETGDAQAPEEAGEAWIAVGAVAWDAKKPDGTAPGLTEKRAAAALAISETPAALAAGFVVPREIGAASNPATHSKLVDDEALDTGKLKNPSADSFTHWEVKADPPKYRHAQTLTYREMDGETLVKTYRLHDVFYERPEATGDAGAALTLYITYRCREWEDAITGEKSEPCAALDPSEDQPSGYLDEIN